MFDMYVSPFSIKGTSFWESKVDSLFNKLLYAYIFPNTVTFEHMGYFVYPEFKM